MIKNDYMDASRGYGAALFCVLFLGGKGSLLIAGYNTMDEAEKAKYGQKGLCTFMEKSVLAMGACCLIMAPSDAVDTMAPVWIGLTLFLCVIIFTVVCLNTGNRLKK